MTVNNLIYRIKLLKGNWRLVIHLLFSTYHFGVNNQTWAAFPSMFGRPIIIRFNPFQIIENYGMMKFRMKIGFLPKDKVVKLGWWR